MKICSALAITCRRSAIFAVAIVRNSKSWQREEIVSGTLCSSVVAMMKTTFGGGSSIVLSNALNALSDNMCISSMMKTLKRSRAGLMPMFVIMTSRTLSMPVFEAASISSTSIERPSAISRQEAQAVSSVVAQGVAVGLSTLWQLSALATSRAVV